jgi:acyl-CoA reductase-like NAD-dependent aldehyde dehydrogenase
MREVDTMLDRAQTMLAWRRRARGTTTCLKEGFNRYIRREPLGIVLNIPAWKLSAADRGERDYPGASGPGNAVLIKHARLTPAVRPSLRRGLSAGPACRPTWWLPSRRPRDDP